MWSGVGVGTGALIGTAVTAALEVRDQKRISRFNGMNAPSAVSSYFSEFQEILTLGASTNTNAALRQIASFIRKYPKNDSVLLPDVYLLRAAIYTEAGRYNQAATDLKTVMDDFPSQENYEAAAKLLGDIYMEQKRYLDAFEAYTEALKARSVFPQGILQERRLEALYELALGNRRYVDLFLENAEDLDGLSPAAAAQVRQQVNDLSL